MPKLVEIFWTGGYDSSFRIAQLSRKQVLIQPYYLSDNRPSEACELKAIEEITEALKKNPQTKCTFRPLIYISVNERKNDSNVSEAFKELRKQDYMGSQYEWLGTFAQEYHGIELSIHKDDKAMLLIQKHGVLEKVYDDTLGESYILDEDKSSEALKALFGKFHFPLAMLTKLDMKEKYAEMGLLDIADKTWFCYTPVNGLPCGKCNPCQYTIQEGMKARFTPMALMRYHFYTKVRPLLKRIPGLKKIISFLKR